jgi:hypothetical protein
MNTKRLFKALVVVVICVCTFTILNVPSTKAVSPERHASVVVATVQATRTATSLPTAVPTSTNPPTPTSTFTFTPTATVTMVPTATLLPTSTPPLIPTPTAVPTLRPNFAWVPPAVLLDAQTTSTEFVAELVELIKASGLTPTTYAEMMGKKVDNPLIIIFDHVMAAEPVPQSFMDMAQVLNDAKYPAVLALCSKDDELDSTILYVSKLSKDFNWQMAANSDKYDDLSELNAWDLQYTRLTRSAMLIKSYFSPRSTTNVTFVLPYGKGAHNPNLRGAAQATAKRVLIRTIVTGESGFETYDTTESTPHIFSAQMPVNNDAQQTFDVMLKRFAVIRN